MRYLLFVILSLSFISFAAAQNDSPHPENIYKVGFIGGAQISSNASLDAKLGLVVERCADFGFRSGVIFRSWNPQLSLDAYQYYPDSLAGQFRREYYGQETFNRLFMAGIPLQLNYYFRDHLRVNAGVQADFVFASRSTFVSAAGDDWLGKGTGHRAIVSPSLSAIAGIDYQLARGVWLNAQYQGGFGPFLKKDVAQPAISYEGANPARQHFSLSLMVYFWRFEDSGKMKGTWLE
ncbi:MAG: hypothetical protein AAFN10_26265 [Bacteroidota bacterium]